MQEQITVFHRLIKNRLDVIIMMCAYYLNGDKNKRCAFCKYWYDPTNQYIRPQNPKNGIWKFETTANKSRNGCWNAVQQI